MKLKAISPNIMVPDVRKTAAFYRDVLGFEITSEVPGDGESLVWASVKRDDVEVMFQSEDSLTGELPDLKGQRVGAGGPLTFYIRVEGLDELYEAIKQKNPAVILHDIKMTFYGMRELEIRDCNGFFLNFAEPEKKGSETKSE